MNGRHATKVRDLGDHLIGKSLVPVRIVTKRFIVGVAAAAEKNGLLPFNDLAIRTFNPDRAAYFQGPPGYDFENGLLILHLLAYHP